MNTEIRLVNDDAQIVGVPTPVAGLPVYRYVSDKEFINTFNKLSYGSDKPISGISTKFYSSVAGLYDAENNVILQAEVSIADSKFIFSDNLWLNEYRFSGNRYLVIEANECETIDTIRGWIKKKLPKLCLSEARFFIGSRLSIVWTPDGSFFAIPLDANGNTASGMNLVREYDFISIDHYAHIPNFSPMIGFNFTTASPVIKSEIELASARNVVDNLGIKNYPYGIIKVLSESASEIEIARLFIDISKEDEQKILDFTTVINDPDFIKSRLDYYLYPINLYNEREALEFRFAIRSLRLRRVIRTPSTEHGGLTTITFVSDTGEEYEFRCVFGLEEAFLQSSVI